VDLDSTTPLCKLKKIYITIFSVEIRGYCEVFMKVTIFWIITCSVVKLQMFEDSITYNLKNSILFILMQRIGTIKLKVLQSSFLPGQAIENGEAAVYLSMT
jgi:hypothetical protein